MTTSTTSTEQTNEKPIEWLFDSRYRWAYHFMFWVFVYLDEILAVVGITDEIDFNLSFFITFGLDLGMVYATIYWLLPEFLMKGKVKVFLFWVALLVAVNSMTQFTLMTIYDEFFKTDTPALKATIITGWMVASFLITGVAVGIKLFKSYILNEVRLKKLETDNLKTELVYLKNQMNPHFLFNSLNNIYVLNRKDSNMASESILMLSDLLRYQLYDCAKDKVPLKGEIDYLKNFLELDQLRKDNLDLVFNVKGNLNGYYVPPFMFIPFVENAIKHSASTNNETTLIEIKFDIDEKEYLTFTVQNSKPQQPLITETGGIGISNVKRRLELIYPNDHDLQITNDPDNYKIKLNVKLKHA